jgi:tetratricopeptide (TPR) repeat protein
MAALFALASCSGYVKRGSSLYADGRYVEAAEVFERTEYRLNEAEPRERAEYAMYRGMTLLVLGDLRGAQRWLAYAYEVERHTPGSLRADRRALLDRGWFELGQRLRSEPPPAKEPTGTAIAASQPPAPVPQPPPDGASPPVEDERTLVPR